MVRALLVLLALLGQLAVEGMGACPGSFSPSFPSGFLRQAGIISAWVGTILVMFLTAVSAIPLGNRGGHLPGRVCTQKLDDGGLLKSTSPIWPACRLSSMD